MQKLPRPESPQYMVGSVDKALRLIHMLRDHGEVRLRSAAEELGVAESTAHRLMAMLVFHGFARQTESRAYVPGLALGSGPVRASHTRALREVAPPHLDWLRAQTGETVNLCILVGSKVRFLLSREGDYALRIIERSGRVIPALGSAAGRVLLADLGEVSLRRLYQGQIAEARGEALTDAAFGQLLGSLRLARSRGYATGEEETEVGVSAIAMPIRDETGRVIASVSIAAPAVRFDEIVAPPTLHAVTVTRDRIERDLYAHTGS